MVGSQTLRVGVGPGREISSIVARAAAIDSGFPNKVPPVAIIPERSPSGPLVCVRNMATSSAMPHAPNALVRSRSASWNPSSGRTRPTLFV